MNGEQNRQTNREIQQKYDKDVYNKQTNKQKICSFFISRNFPFVILNIQRYFPFIKK